MKTLILILVYPLLWVVKKLEEIKEEDFNEDTCNKRFVKEAGNRNGKLYKDF